MRSSAIILRFWKKNQMEMLKMKKINKSSKKHGGKHHQ
jgi:hypothetical protein